MKMMFLSQLQTIILYGLHFFLVKELSMIVLNLKAMKR